MLPTSLETSLPHNTTENKQLWMFEFPQEFDTEQFAKLNLSLPENPVDSVRLIHKFSIETSSGEKSYVLLEVPGVESEPVVNLFPDADQEQNTGHLLPGSPFTRKFRVVEDHGTLEIQDPDDKAAIKRRKKENRKADRSRMRNLEHDLKEKPLVPQLSSMKVNFFPVGHQQQQPVLPKVLKKKRKK